MAFCADDDRERLGRPQVRRAGDCCFQTGRPARSARTCSCVNALVSERCTTTHGQHFGDGHWQARLHYTPQEQHRGQHACFAKLSFETVREAARSMDGFRAGT
jgi:hypothetical protein